MDPLDGMMVSALWTGTKLGPNDELLTQHAGKTYWVSTIRYPGAGWQTGVFNRKRVLWLMRPIFRVNEMDGATRALLNHFTAIIMVAEAAPETWPKGMNWTEPSESSWLEARAKTLIESPRDNLEGLVKFYSTLRSKYHCAHR